MRSKGKGIILATAASLLIISQVWATESPSQQVKFVRCYGVNSCKGKGQCGTTTTFHNCAGRNSCKGRGWIYLSADECKKQGGKIFTGKLPH